MPLLRCQPCVPGYAVRNTAAMSFLGVPKADVKDGLPFVLGSNLTDADIEELGLRHRFPSPIDSRFVVVPERGELHFEVNVHDLELGRRIDRALERCLRSPDLMYRTWPWTVATPMPLGCHRIGEFEFRDKRRKHHDERCTFCRARGPRRFDYPVDLRDAAVPLVAAAKRLCTHLLHNVYERLSVSPSREQHFFLYTKGHGSEGARYGNGLWVELEDKTWKMVYAPDEWARMHEPDGLPMSNIEAWIWQLGEAA